jgi:hypothetical protein
VYKRVGYNNQCLIYLLLKFVFNFFPTSMRTGQRLIILTKSQSIDLTRGGFLLFPRVCAKGRAIPFALMVG